MDAMLRRYFPDDVHHVDGLQNEVLVRLPVRGRILDLGCGDNSMLSPHRDADREVWGTDFNAHPNLVGPAFFRELGPDGRIPFPDEWFDLVVSVSVMEHVEDPQAFFGEIHRVLRPGGFYIGHSISGAHYVTWLRRVTGLLPHRFNQWLVRRLYGRPEVDTFPTRYRLNRAGEIERAARAADLRSITLRRYADPYYFSFWRPLLPLAIAADWALERIAPGWGRLYFTVTLQKPLPLPAPELAPPVRRAHAVGTPEPRRAR